MTTPAATAGHSLSALKIQITHNMTLDPDLKTSAFRAAVFLLVVMVDRNTGRCFITDARLAKCLGMSVDNVRRHVKRQAGFLRYFDVRVGKFRGHATEYAITESALRGAITRKAGALDNMEPVPRTSGGSDTGPDTVTSGPAAAGTKPGTITPNDAGKGGKSSSDSGKNSRQSAAKAGKNSVTTQYLSFSNPDCAADGAQGILDETGKRGETEIEVPGRAADLIARFIAAFPREGNRGKVKAAFAAAIEAGADPSHIIDAARAYAAEQEGNEKRFMKYPENWLRERRWKQHAPAQRATRDQILAARATHIRAAAGKPWLTRTMSAAKARECVAAGLVTLEECRAAGVLS